MMHDVLQNLADAGKKIEKCHSDAWCISKTTGHSEVIWVEKSDACSSVNLQYCANLEKCYIFKPSVKKKKKKNLIEGK